MKRRILVIGGTAAGPSAASKAKRTDPDAEVIMFEQGDDISSGICEMPYYVGNVVDDVKKLTSFTPERLEKEKGVIVRVRHHVDEISPSSRKIAVRNLDSGKVREERYDSLVIATGSRPRSIGLAGENARNVFHVKSLEGTIGLKRVLADEKPGCAVIIGGGYIGMEMAEALAANGLRTTLLHRHNLPMMGLEEESQKAVAVELAAHGVEFVPNVSVQALAHNPGGSVYAVKTAERTYDCDLVVIAAGVEPNTSLAAESGIRLGQHRGILTDQRQTTSDDSIYAAGDCCEVRNLVSNRFSYIPLATTASKQGWTAGENAAGGSAVFKGVIRAIGVKIFDLQVAHVGLSSREARESSFDPVVEHIEAPSKISFYPGSERVHIIAVADKSSGRILGANVYGKEGAIMRANVLAVAIQHGLTADEVSRLDLIYTPPYAPLWDPVLVLGNQLRKRIENEKPGHH